MCPGTQDEDIKCYKNLKDCKSQEEIDKENVDEEQDSDANKSCEDIYKECLENSPCTSGASSFSTFGECFSGCKQQCTDNCNEMACTEGDKKACEGKCNDNSKCIIDNAGKCLVSFDKLSKCSDKNSSEYKDCVKSAALCQYCSDQYAGYPDCLTSSYSTKGNYSASYIYKHLDYQLCKYPNSSTTSGEDKTKTTCITLYPETIKCPASSQCPDCPCDNVKEKVDYEADAELPQAEKDACWSSEEENSNNEENTKEAETKKIEEYRVCSGNCDEFSYDDDPLTFYCKTNWWTKEAAKKTTPEGLERVCLQTKEIPVGLTVDDAEVWGQEFLNIINASVEKTNDLKKYISGIGKEKDYCECGSKCDDAKKESACQAKCAFNQTDPITDPDTGEIITPAKCWCARQSCSGNPCQKMVNLFKGKAKGKSCPEGVEYKGVDYYRIQIANNAKDFYIFTIEQSRSDIVKELNYSRTKTNECSTTQNNYGSASTELLSCTRVEDEIISPIVDSGSTTIIDKTKTASYCYGQELGKVLDTTNSPLMDNWFCCEVRKKESQ